MKNFADNCYVETAGEIKDVYPVSCAALQTKFDFPFPCLTGSNIFLQDKPVTIVQGDKYLLSDIYPQKFRMDVERRLRLRGIDVIFEDKVEGRPVLEPGTPLTTKKGKTLNCDLLVRSFHFQQNISYNILQFFFSDNSTRSGSKHFSPPNSRTSCIDGARLRESVTKSSTPISSFHICVGRYHGFEGS